MMDSEIQVASAAGAGSRFWFTLEVAPAAAALSAAEHSAAANDRAPPPRAQLDQLHRLAHEGDMRAIRQLADDIEALGVPYLAFAQLLRQLAREYQSKALVELALQYVETAP